MTDRSHIPFGSNPNQAVYGDWPGNQPGDGHMKPGIYTPPSIPPGPPVSGPGRPPGLLLQHQNGFDTGASMPPRLFSPPGVVPSQMNGPTSNAYPGAAQQPNIVNNHTRPMNAPLQQFNTRLPGAQTTQSPAVNAPRASFNTQLPNAPLSHVPRHTPPFRGPSAGPTMNAATTPALGPPLPNAQFMNNATGPPLPSFASNAPVRGSAPHPSTPYARQRQPMPVMQRPPFPPQAQMGVRPSPPGQVTPPYMNQPPPRPAAQHRMPPPSSTQPPHQPRPQLITSSHNSIATTGLPPQPALPPQPGMVQTPRMPPPSGMVNGLPVPFHGQAQYTHQIGPTVNAPPTPEPNKSQRSSRSGTPVVQQNFDALEGGFTPLPAAAQHPQPPTSGPAPPVSHAGPTGRRQYPNMPGVSSPSQPAFPPAPLSTSQPPFDHVNQAATNQSGFIQPPYNTIQPPTFNQQPPTFNQQPPTFNQQPPTFNQQPPTFNQQPPTFNQPPSFNQQPSFNQPSQPVYGVGGLNAPMANMALQESSNICNLLQERCIFPAAGPENPQPHLQDELKNASNCHPDVFRCTLNAIPQTSALLNKARLPLGILIHPFKDLSQLPVIQSSVIVRCRSCRTYINPFVTFESDRNWKCNLCYRVNTVPDEFSFDPVSKTYGNPQRRPEIKSSTIEFIAPSEYMLRPPQPAVYLYLLDISFNAIETGYLNVVCDTLVEEIDKIPGDARTQVCFIAYDTVLRFFNLSEGLSQPQMLIVSEIDDVFLPCPEGLMVNLHESKDLVIDLLTQLPTLVQDNRETSSALGAALHAAYKLMSTTGGRVTVFQTILPSVGPGALQTREDPNQRASSKVDNLGPATDFYKRLALDCSAQQIAVDLFMLNGQFSDIATLACISKFSGGCLHHYPSFHTVSNTAQRDKFEMDLRRYIVRKIGLEAVMRIRCTKGLSIHTFHGNFFVRSTDLLSLPNINPDSGFGMQMSIEDSLTDSPDVSFQAALLYTSSKGERRIRVHTLCVPVTNSLGVVFAQADQYAVASLVAKMAVDRTVAASLTDAKEAMTTCVVDAFGAYAGTLTPAQRTGNALLTPHALRLLPLYMLALSKSKAFRTGVSTKLDERVIELEQFKTLPLKYLLQKIYPCLYAVHALDDQNVIKKGERSIANPPLLQLSSANIDRHGVFVLDTMDDIVMLVGAAVSDQFCLDVFDVPNYMSLADSLDDLPELENPVSERLRMFIAYLIDKRPLGATFTVIREDSKQRHLFFAHMVEDRTESSMSYYEYIQYIQKQLKT